MKDLEIIFHPTFCFVRHIHLIVTKAHSMLGFIMICADLVFCILSFAHVWSYLKYAAAKCNPNYDVSIKRIESVQKKVFFVFI